MSPYYKYKKEKFLEKYKAASETLEDLKIALYKYRNDKDKIVRRAIFAYFQDFCEYIIDMCESYLVINKEKVDSNISSVQLIEKAHEKGFFDDTLKDFLSNSVKLRNRYTHDYYKREVSEKQIEEYCYSNIIYLEIFLESSKEDVILTYRNGKID
ncbi:MAG: HepT-like ribonuclease domain-containing protein [Clostridium sp.]|nr:HepT-like ribonuclease domain-containing protein [Clostridium sp.]